jgi:hypothetical protein
VHGLFKELQEHSIPQFAMLFFAFTGRNEANKYSDAYGFLQLKLNKRLHNF